ncbi:prephenate dehydrogenase/arogenate dehydrogenase family protein [Oricola sp.]|uniref:prephenate dehydrogenase/arogenate dehydrogenase family protein n=1 Tax=Oricola sp. TaxID=1979950 RepID=UPI003510F143
MEHQNPAELKPSIGVIGFGTFGRLIARHAAPYFGVCVHDIAPEAGQAAASIGAVATTLEHAAACDIVVIATPVPTFADILSSVAAHCRPGALVLDVGSVKIGPSALMRQTLPLNVDIVATHPLFGPQSARNGLAGLKIALCPIRGERHRALAAFLRRRLGLQVIVTTPEDHDREAATVQGLTHLIAKVLTRMDPLPTRMTTRSFDLLVEAVSMVRHDAPEVFEAIERSNPYSAEVRRRFFELAHELDAELARRDHVVPKEPDSTTAIPANGIEPSRAVHAPGIIAY